jgi:arylsulfatase A-like enzyme
MGYIDSELSKLGTVKVGRLMNRREFVRMGAAVPLAAKLPVATPKRKQPNVLYVFSDQHRQCSLPGQPHNGAIAPNIAKFGHENLSFNQCISNYPVCSPYRGMLMSGLWPMQSGIVDNAMQLPTTVGSIGHAFSDAGYDTSYIGKWHLARNDGNFIPTGAGRQGFKDWHVWARTNPHFDKSFTFDPNTGARIQPKGYNCTLMTDQAVEFIHSRAAEAKPWMVMLSWNPPHPPFGDAPNAEKALMRPENLPLRPNVKLNASHSNALESETRLREVQRNYFAHIAAVDLEFARLLKALDETGQTKDTIVIYTSDHGEMMGSQGYMDKRLPWEESCNVPFMVRYPGVTPREKTSDILFSTIDIYPTLCGLAGIPIPPHCRGRDLSGAMRGEPIQPPASVFLMHISKDHATDGDENVAPLFRGIRTNRHTYAIANDGRWCLYDNQEDPFQQNNLVDEASTVDLRENLEKLILNWMKQAEDSFPLVSLSGKLSVHANEAATLPVIGTDSRS